MTVSFDLVFFSPHLDDAILNCGDLIRESVERKKQVLIISVFTEMELVKTSFDNANLIPKKWQNNIYNWYETRREEDKKVMGVLGIDYDHLGFTEAYYRNKFLIKIGNIGCGKKRLYSGMSEILNGKIKKYDRNYVLKSVARSISEIVKNNGCKNTSFYFCSGLNNHVDHRLIFEVAKKIIEKGLLKSDQIIFWDDSYSYDRKTNINLVYLKKENTRILNKESYNRKIKLLSLYKTQNKIFKDLNVHKSIKSELFYRLVNN
jgi:LmbE family N-acetylglucosaminyl deacetylase